MPTLFDRASEVFPTQQDPETGARVMKLATRNHPPTPAHPNGETGPPWAVPQRFHAWRTQYHQFSCFLDGGRRIALQYGPELQELRIGYGAILDLDTGVAHDPFPPHLIVLEVHEAARRAILVETKGDTRHSPADAILWDLDAGREIFRIVGDTYLTGAALLRGGSTLLAGFMDPHGAPHTRVVLREEAEPDRLVTLIDQPGYWVNHFVPSPIDDELLACNKWPRPLDADRPCFQAMHLIRLDGSVDRPVPLDARAIPCGPMYGQRDHFAWLPDGQRIASYFMPNDPQDLSNHFKFDWWINVTDIRTGRDVAQRYPPGRWGGHFNPTPTGRHLICLGHHTFPYLFAVGVDALEHGWNERILARIPETRMDGSNHGLFHHPHVLPDGSGVVFTAGWPDADVGVYICELPPEL